MYIGVDGCSDGWIAVAYDGRSFAESGLYNHIESLWTEYGGIANTILIDVPIGLRENSNAKRPCDDAARATLGHPRTYSVFPVPIRDAVHEDDYEDGKLIQENRTAGSIGTQSWNITDKIAQVDTFLRETNPSAKEVLRESHPEVCFWALDGERATSYSKTGQPAAAFWERIRILESVDDGIVNHVRSASTDLDADVGNDDIVDAFALALTASEKTGEFQELPDSLPDDDPGDPSGLPMEMVYAFLA